MTRPNRSNTSNIEQIPLDLGHRPALGREDFLIAPPNADAVEWIDRWPEWPAPALVLYGAPASGKSHLAAVWQSKTNAATVDTTTLSAQSADKISALGEHLVLDHIDPWFGDRAAETTLFHLYNIMKEEQRTMLLTMRMAPTHVPFCIPDLASRLRAAPAISIQTPDDMLLSAILVKLFADRQLQISHDVIMYLLPRMERSFAAVYDLVEAADKLALAEKRAISVPLMRRVLLERSELAGAGELFNQ